MQMTFSVIFLCYCWCVDNAELITTPEYTAVCVHGEAQLATNMNSFTYRHVLFT